MRNSLRRRIVLFAALVLAVSVAVFPAAPARLYLTVRTACGPVFDDDASERWAVKTLKDEDRATVNFRPVDTTIRALRAAVPPAMGAAAETHRSSGIERTVWRVKAQLVYVEHEKDGDLHLVIAEPDDPALTMITEVPAFYENLRFVTDWVVVRWKLWHRGLSGAVNVPVEIEGVGFFDVVHGQYGVAPNGIELHPILRIKLGRNNADQG